MTIMAILGIHTGCIGGIFITGIFTLSGGNFWLSKREFPVALQYISDTDIIVRFRVRQLRIAVLAYEDRDFTSC